MLVQLKQELSKYMQQEKTEPFRPSNFMVESSIYTDRERYEEEVGVLQNALIERNDPRYLFSDGRVFLNSCPHRGARLKETTGGHVCTYHGWKFDQEGHLSQSTGHSCPYPKGSLKLQELEVSFMGGKLIRGDSAYADEIKHISKIYSFVEEKSYQVKCNWKLLVESLLETYHFPFAHTPYLEGFENAFYSQGSVNEQNARIIVPLSNFERSLDEKSLEGINVMYFFFPFTFALFMSSGVVWFQITPQSVNESQFDCSLYSYGVGEETAKKSLGMLDKILDQDFTILEGQQRNAKIPQRFHFTGYEKLIRAFHQNLTVLLKKPSP